MNFAIDIKAREPSLIDACVRKERWAQEEVYSIFYGSMMGVCLRYSNNKTDAQDILHEGFIKVFRHIAKYKTGTSLHAWIRRIMINTAIDFYRKETRRRTEPIEGAYGLSDKRVGPISKLTEKEILKSIQLLTPAYRSVFNLYVIEGYAHKEIAELLGISESTSRSNLVKARAKLREILREKQLANGR